MTFNWVTRRLRTLYVAGDTKGDTHAMTHMHLAVFMGIKPVMFVSKHGSQAVRMVLPPTARPKASDGKGKEKGGGKSSKEDSSKDGLKCYVAQKKPIIGIAPHPARMWYCMWGVLRGVWWRVWRMCVMHILCMHMVGCTLHIT